MSVGGVEFLLDIFLFFPFYETIFNLKIKQNEEKRASNTDFLDIST